MALRKDGTTDEQWEQYEKEVEKHSRFCERIKPLRQSYLTDAAYKTDMAEWDRVKFMDRPNPPGYFRAAND